MPLGGKLSWESSRERGPSARVTRRSRRRRHAASGFAFFLRMELGRFKFDSDFAILQSTRTLCGFPEHSIDRPVSKHPTVRNSQLRETLARCLRLAPERSLCESSLCRGVLCEKSPDIVGDLARARGRFRSFSRSRERTRDSLRASASQRDSFRIRRATLRRLVSETGCARLECAIWRRVLESRP